MSATFVAPTSCANGLPSASFDGDRRVAVRAVLLVVATAVIALSIPAVPLMLVPLAFGVPHLASELRWLVIRRRLPRPLAMASIPLGAALAALGVSTWAGLIEATLSATIEVTLASAWIVAAAACGRGARRLVVGALASVAAVLALLFQPTASVFRDVAVGTHAFVTIAIWIVLYRKRKLYVLPAMLGLSVGLAAVALVRGPLVAQAFLLSVHYLVWLVLLPQDAARHTGAPSTSIRGWLKDFGPVGLLLVGAAIVAIGALALVLGSSLVRDGYLAIARFHVWFELAVASLVLSNGRLEARL